MRGLQTGRTLLLLLGLLAWPAADLLAAPRLSSRKAKAAAPSRGSVRDDALIRAAASARGKLDTPRNDVLGKLIQELREKEALAGIAETPPAANSDLIAEAMRNRGRPYVWGGSSRNGFDCSGFVCYLFYLQRGIQLPHNAAAQVRHGAPVSSAELLPGDLLFFRTERAGISHVGVFIGNGQFIHAANSRRDVRVDGLAGYYANRLKAARRIATAPIRVTSTELEWLRSRLSESDTNESSGKP